MAKRHPKLRLSRLRDIGWTLWDPIGLMPAGQKWDDPDCLGWANEYDSYLVKAAGDLRRGHEPAAVVDDLIKAEADTMGLGVGNGARLRAQSVVQAILANDLLWNDDA